MFKNIFLLFKIKYTFANPEKKSILVLDLIYKDLLKKILKKKTFNLLKIRLEEINIKVLIKLLFSKKRLDFFNYVVKYIELTQPNSIVTGTDNLIWFYKLKKLFPKIKFIAIQNGFRNKLFFDELKKEKNLYADYIFTFNNSFSKLYKKFIKTKTVVLGSVKNNSIRINKRINKKDLLFISSGYPVKNNNFSLYNKVIFKREDYFNEDKILLKNLLKYCKKKGLNIKLIPKFSNNLCDEEIEYYKKDLGSKNLKFIKKISKDPILGSKKIYKKADRSLITISTASTFGFENLARGNRTAIFNNKIKISKKIIDIFWNYKINKKGIFWSNECSYKEVKRILDFLIYDKKSQLHTKVKNISKDLMVYNFNNSMLRQILNK